MTRTLEAPHVRLVSGQQFLDGEPTDVIVNAAEHEVTVTDSADHETLCTRLVLAGMVYQREVTRPDARHTMEPPPAGDGISLICWPPPTFAKFIPTVPVRGRDSAYPGPQE